MSKLGARPVESLRGKLPLRHVLKGTDEHGPPVHVFHHVSNGVEMLHVPTRGDDAVGEIHIHALDGAFERGFEYGHVLGVNSLPNGLQCHLRRGIELEDAQGFFGPIVRVRHQVGNKTPCLA